MVVDEVAEADPYRPFISVPQGADRVDNFIDISYKAFATAINRVTWWIEESIGRSQRSEPVFYIGPLDIRYLLILMAAAKTGHVVS